MTACIICQCVTCAATSAPYQDATKVAEWFNKLDRPQRCTFTQTMIAYKPCHINATKLHIICCTSTDATHPSQGTPLTIYLADTATTGHRLSTACSCVRLDSAKIIMGCALMCQRDNKQPIVSASTTATCMLCTSASLQKVQPDEHHQHDDSHRSIIAVVLNVHGPTTCPPAPPPTYHAQYALVDISTQPPSTTRTHSTSVVHAMAYLLVAKLLLVCTMAMTNTLCRLHTDMCSKRPTLRRKGGGGSPLAATAAHATLNNQLSTSLEQLDLYCEPQESMFCGVHALNAMFGRRVTSAPAVIIHLRNTWPEVCGDSYHPTQGNFTVSALNRWLYSHTNPPVMLTPFLTNAFTRAQYSQAEILSLLPPHCDRIFVWFVRGSTHTQPTRGIHHYKCLRRSSVDGEWYELDSLDAGITNTGMPMTQRDWLCLYGDMYCCATLDASVYTRDCGWCTPLRRSTLAELTNNDSSMLPLADLEGGTVVSDQPLRMPRSSPADHAQQRQVIRDRTSEADPGWRTRRPPGHCDLTLTPEPHSKRPSNKSHGKPKLSGAQQPAGPLQQALPVDHNSVPGHCQPVRDQTRMSPPSTRRGLSNRNQPVHAKRGSFKQQDIRCL
jgi:hypothetical protein